MSRFRTGPLSLLLCAATACVGHGADEGWTPDPHEASPTASLQPRTRAPVVPPGRLLQTYHNVEMSVAHPGRSAAAARALAEDAGGEVLSMHADAQQGSLTVAVDPDLADRVRHALVRLPGTVIRENSNASDVSEAVRQLDGRLGRLELAEAEMDRIMRGANDPAMFDAWMVQRELNARERDSLHAQIASYLQQVRRTQIGVTFSTAVLSTPAPRMPSDG